MSSIHFHPETTARVEAARANIYGQQVATCGAYVKSHDVAFRGIFTADRDAVTCKRCLKCLAPGMSVDLGHLVSPSNGR